jgi:dTDP-glucose pyrophosphorylase
MIVYPELKKFILKQHSSLEEAIKIINLNGKGICLIVGNNYNLKGILTDGDVRRLILKGALLKESIYNKYNKNFFSIKNNNFSKINLNELKKKFIHVPIVKNKKIISLLLKDDLSFKKKKNKIFILAGGLGKRMGYLTKNTPKPMLKIKKKPILEHQINFFKKKGFCNFIISVNYLSKKIINYFKDGKKLGVQIDYCKETSTLGTAGPLSLLRKKKIDDNIIVINGDIYANINFEQILDFHKKKNNDLTLCARRQQYQFPFGIINANTKLLDFINEKPDLNFLVNTGIYIMKPKVLKMLKFNKFLDMNLFINNLKKNKNKIGIYLIYEKIFDIGNKFQYRQVSNLFNK